MAAGARFKAAFCAAREAGHRPGKTHAYGAVIVIFELNEKMRKLAVPGDVGTELTNKISRTKKALQDTIMKKKVLEGSAQ